MKANFIIRAALQSDAVELKKLFQNTVLAINRRDYSQAEVEDWASCGDDLSNIENMIKTHYFIVAVNQQSEIVGFSSITPQGYLHSMFVHKDFQGEGIATILLNEIEQYAITNGIIPILGLLIMHLIISIINMKSIKAREIICGKPRILIYRGKIDEKALIKERFTINELEERLRGNNIMNLGDIEYAILETSGQVTVIPKPEKRNVIAEDLNITPEYEGIPYDLVVDGKVMNKNLKKIGKDYNWLKKEVRKFNMNPEEALIVTYDGKGQIFCQKKEN